jgi:hypothetical protein
MDKVVGLVGLMEAPIPHLQVLQKVDYLESIAEVYTGVVRLMLQECSELVVLDYVLHDN